MNQSRPKLWTQDFIVVSSVNFFLTLIFYLLMVTIAVYAVHELDASTSQAGLITGIFIIGTLIGRLFIGSFIDKIGRKRTLMIGLIFFTLTTLLYFVNFGITFLLFNRFLHGIILGCGMLLLSSADKSITFLLAGALIGLGFGNMQSCTQAVAVKLTPPHRMGLATSTFFISLDAGLGFGPYLLGFIIPLTGYRTLYVILGFLIMATSVLYYFMHGRKEIAAKTRIDALPSK